MEITAIDPGVSFKLGTATLDAVGEAAPIGQMPNLHVHGEWRLLLPDGVVGAYVLAFRLTTTARAYAPSPSYAFTVTNSPEGAGASSTTTLPALAGVGLSGAMLAIRPAAMSVRSRDAAVGLGGGNGSPDDPTRAGARLRLLADAAAPLDLRYDLPAAGWQTIGKSGRNKGYRYRDRSRRAGPVTAVTIRSGKAIAIAGKGINLGATLAAEPDGVDIVLDLGTRRYCMRFGGTTRFRPARFFGARNAPPPAACPEEP
jgi:hypothetical protein